MHPGPFSSFCFVFYILVLYQSLKFRYCDSETSMLGLKLLFLNLYFYCVEWRAHGSWLPPLRWWNSHNDEATSAPRPPEEESHRCRWQRNRCVRQIPVIFKNAFYIFYLFCLSEYMYFFCLSEYMYFFCFVFSDRSPSCRGLDLAFKTPIRPIIRREHVLSEIDQVTPRNTTARNIYSTPIVRFLTPSKESEYNSVYGLYCL